jgi:hypothetical protein
MPLYFVTFLAMLAASLLLYLVALTLAVARRRPLPIWIAGAAASRLQGTNVVLMWWNVGVAWLLYFNVYRIHLDMSALGDAALQAFSRGYTTRLPIVVLPYGVICLLGVLALWSEPARASRRALWGIATLFVLTVLATPFAAGAQGDIQEHGFTQQAYQQLQMSHLVRSVLTTIAALWGIAEGWRLPKHDAGLSGHQISSH